jgi:hypothetical protein
MQKDSQDLGAGGEEEIYGNAELGGDVAGDMAEKIGNEYVWGDADKEIMQMWICRAGDLEV